MQDTAVTVLEEEHQRLQTLFARVSAPDEDRPAVLKDLIKTLSAHVAMEIQMLVPVVKARVPDGDALAEHLTDYHDKVGKTLIIIERRKVNSPDLPGYVTELLDLTEAHVSEADATLLPALREALTPEALRELGASMLSDERQLLTHSHPHLPDTGPVAKVTRWAASVVDRGRDKSTDTGRSSS